MQPVNRWENGVHKPNAETLVLNVTGEDVMEIVQHMRVGND